MEPLDALDSVAVRTGFSGVVRVDRAGSIEFAKAYGLADRAHEIPNAVDTRFGIASGSKGMTARGGEPDRGRFARSHDDGSIGAGGGSAADRRRRDDRTAAAPVRDR
jgi:hypothetical protein